MNANLFNQVISGAIGEAMREGVAKGKMSVVDVAGILNSHTGNVLQLMNEAAAHAIQAEKQTREIVIPFERNVRIKISPLVKIPQEDIDSNRHGNAECNNHDCPNPVRWYREDTDINDTYFWCDEHKPE